MSDDLVQRVLGLVRQVSDDPARLRSPASTDALLAELESLTLVELVVRMEAEFGVEIAAELITPANFGSVTGLVGVLRTCAAGSTHVYGDLVDAGPGPAGGETVVDVLRHRAAEQPDDPFLTWISAGGESEVLTYGALEERSRALASALASGSAISGERIGLLAANDIPTVLAIFAILRAGGVCLFLNPADPSARLRTILAAHPARRVLRSSYVTNIPADLAEPIRLPGAASVGDEAERPITARDPAFMFGTSGSTAAGKLVLQGHRAVLSNARALTEHLDLRPGTKIAGGLPVHHVNGVHFTLTAVLCSGSHVLLPQEYSPLTYRALLDSFSPHLASVVPSMLEALLATGRGWRPPSSLRFFVSAAAPMSASLAGRVREAFGVRVVQGYGLTETTNFSTMIPPGISDHDYAALVLDAAVPTVGVAFPDNEVEVLSPTGELLGENTVGEVCMRGPNVMIGYAGAPDLNADAFRGGWFHSGDLGRWARGPGGRRYLTLTGRSKNIAKVRGEAVSLEEVEHALLSLEGVVDAGCVALPHPLWGEEIVAVVALRDVDVSELRPRLAAMLSPSALPRRWHQVAAIPRTPTGKLQRSSLLEQVTSGEAT